MNQIKAKKAKFQFEGYRIDKSTFKRSPGEIGKSISIQFNPRAKFDSQSNLYELTLGLLIKDVSEVLEIEIETVGNFKLEKDCDDFEMKNYFSINAPAILFPYIRAYIATLTTLSGYLNPITLPTMNLTALAKDLEKNTVIL